MRSLRMDRGASKRLFDPCRGQHVQMNRRPRAPHPQARLQIRPHIRRDLGEHHGRSLETLEPVDRVDQHVLIGFALSPRRVRGARVDPPCRARSSPARAGSRRRSRLPARSSRGSTAPRWPRPDGELPLVLDPRDAREDARAHAARSEVDRSAGARGQEGMDLVGVPAVLGEGQGADQAARASAECRSSRACSSSSKR